MPDTVIRKTLNVEGMSCSGCENKIERALNKTDGVKKVRASSARAHVYVEYEEDKVNINKIRDKIEALDYKVTGEKGAPPAGTKDDIKKSLLQVFGLGIIIFAVYFILQNTIGFNFIPKIDQSMSFGLLFVTGLLTSLHCIAMCGGINISQCMTAGKDEAAGKFKGFLPSFLYNSGRVVSYTVIGGIVGAVGSVFNFSNTAKAIIALIAGVFMVFLGLKMLGIFSFLDKINVRIPFLSSTKLAEKASGYGPFVVGLLNGFMPCGPLQTMQLYALGTGSFLTGALSMFFFSVGTVPLMFGVGAASTLMSKKVTANVFKISGAVVMLLGLIMVNRGLSFAGKPVTLASNTGFKVAQVEGNTQTVEIKVSPNSYEPIVVQKGIPVRWVIHVSESDLNGCNNAIVVPKYNIQKKLVPGDNIIEFTPQEEGTIAYSCWMGMIKSRIDVVNNISKVKIDTADNKLNLNSNTSNSAGEQNSFIPSDRIAAAKIENGIQRIVVNVYSSGYSPSVLVLQRGVKAKITFKPVQLTSCNYQIVFPEFNGSLDLRQGAVETPDIPATGDFTFQCGMGMLHGYVKVVDDLSKADLAKISRDIPPQTAQGSGCCGGGGNSGCCGGANL